VTGNPEAARAVPELSAVVLCYRAGANILLVVEPLYTLLSDSGTSFELVLVANYWASAKDRDDTPDYVRRFAATHPHTQVIIRPKEGGMGWDMRSGLEAARGRVIIVIDGDAQNPVDDVLTMFYRMRETKAPVMKGRRVTRYDGPYRRMVSFVYNLFFQLLFGTRGIWDVNGKPKGLTREAYERLDLTSDDWFIDAEIVLKARDLGLAVAEMPVVFHASERASFVRLPAIGEFVVNMLRYRLPRRLRR
jgi:glycosyltransferase involved in cell wall biosynthesis